MRKHSLRLLLGAVVAGSALLALSPGIAKEKKTVEVRAEHSIVDILKLAAENDVHVFVNLVGGKEYSAKVKAVSSHALVLKAPYQRDFYDVYVPLDRIVSVEVRVRER